MTLQGSPSKWPAAFNQGESVSHTEGTAHAPKLRPTMQCHVGLCFLSNSFLMYAAKSFSTLNLSNACTPALA